MNNRSLIYLLKNNVRKSVFWPFFILVGLSFIFHLTWTVIAQRNEKNEIKKSLVKSLQEPLRKKAFLDIKNIITGYNIPKSGVSICLKLKDGLSLSDENCDKAQYEKEDISIINDYFYLSVDKKFNWEVLYSYFILFFMGCLVFYWTREKLTALSKTIISDLNNINNLDGDSPSFHYKELKTAHEEVKKGHYAIQKAQEMKRKEELWKLTTRFAHDMRQPLSVIKKLREGLEQKSNEEGTKLFRNAVQSIESLLSDLLYRHKNPIVKRTLDGPSSEIIGTIRSCISAISLLYPNIKINFENQGAEGIFARISQGDFERVLNNILKNSCEAIPNNGKVNISCSYANGLIIMTIEDDGVGIPQKMIQDIFNENITLGKKDGNGLGLSIARDLLERSNGKIDIESQEGVGAKVILSLSASYLENEIKNSTIVLIDDNDIIKMCWELEAKRRGHHLVYYENYDKLFENIDSHTEKDFFFCDWLIEGKFKGLEASEKLHGMGFKNVYLQTADYDRVKRQDAPWLIGVLDKGYPVKVA